jgi:ribosomal peptide maturation radical SAM protein 1
VAVKRTPAKRGPSVLLMSMPWASVTEPSLGLALLKPKLLEAGIPCRIRHQNIFLLDHFRPESYETVGARWGLNDFLFTNVFEGDELSEDQIDALAVLVRNTYRLIDLEAHASTDPAPFIEYVTKIRNEVIPAYLRDCMRIVDESEATMVGFTCMYDQTFTSLALAKLVKERYPEKLIVLGGYALEPPVGPHILRAFPFVDALCIGEGEDRIVPLARASVDRSLLSTIPNVMYRDGEGAIHEPALGARPVDLDLSPVPHYDDFFADALELDVNHQVEIKIETLPVESSRGCWWGQVSHCTFCGIDDETMRYRAKSPERVQEILATLTKRHGRRLFRFADYILPRQYYKTLLPELAKRDEKYILHWEMKANVKSGEVALMSAAGIIAAQPGIESFSTPVLKKMAKGVTGIQNVLTVKLLTEHNIIVNYNILFGFPEDEPDEYRELVRNIPLLYHLPPPYSYIPVQTTRFAPMQVDPARFGVTAPLVAECAYDTILSKDYRREIGFDIDEYCYIFATPYEFDPACAEYYDMLVYQVAHWIQLHVEREEVRLSYELKDGEIEFVDSRFSEEPATIRFGRDHAVVQAAISERAIAAHRLAAELDQELSATTVAKVLDDLREARLVYEEGERVVGLAFPAACYETWAKLRATPVFEGVDRPERRHADDEPLPPARVPVGATAAGG